MLLDGFLDNPLPVDGSQKGEKAFFKKTEWAIANSDPNLLNTKISLTELQNSLAKLGKSSATGEDLFNDFMLKKSLSKESSLPFASLRLKHFILKFM